MEEDKEDLEVELEAAVTGVTATTGRNDGGGRWPWGVVPGGVAWKHLEPKQLEPTQPFWS